MMRRLKILISAVMFAALGAAAGRIAGELRRQQEAGEEPHLDLDRINVRPRDIVPGVVAAMRVADRPWSFLRIPPWMAAFCMNFAIAAFARELEPLRRVAGVHGDEEDEEFDRVPDGTQPADAEGDATPPATEAQEPPGRNGGETFSAFSS